MRPGIGKRKRALKIIQNIRYLFQLLWNHNKKYFWVTALAFLLPAVTNLIQVVFPRKSWNPWRKRRTLQGQ